MTTNDERRITNNRIGHRSGVVALLLGVTLCLVITSWQHPTHIHGSESLADRGFSRGFTEIHLSQIWYLEYTYSIGQKPNAIHTVYILNELEALADSF